MNTDNPDLKGKLAADYAGETRIRKEKNDRQTRQSFGCPVCLTDVLVCLMDVLVCLIHVYPRHPRLFFLQIRTHPYSSMA